MDGRLRRGVEVIGDAVGVALAQALSPAEMSAASIAIFDGARGRDALFDWEARWFAAALPPPPATVLVTGAGTGTEVRALVERGYTVDAAEPAPALCARLRQGPARTVRCVDHLGALRAGSYDAVLFGWASFTCVLDPAAQRACLDAAAVATRGPILLSLWLAENAGRRPTDPVARAAAVVGRLIGARRGLAAPGDVRFRHWCGFGYVFTRAEIDALAARIGRRSSWQVEIYPRVALMPVAEAAEGR